MLILITSLMIILIMYGISSNCLDHEHNPRPNNSIIVIFHFIFFFSTVAPPLTSPGLAQWISEWPVSCLSYYDIIYPHYFVCFENFQGLDINFGKLLLVYFMSPPRPGGIGCYEAHWSLWPMGNLPPCSPRSGPDPHYFVYIVSRHG